MPIIKLPIKPEIKGYLTLYVDLLGYSMRLRRLNQAAMNAATNGQLPMDEQNEIQLATFAVTEFRKVFEEYFSPNPLDIVDTGGRTLTQGQSETLRLFWESVQPKGFKVLSVSDCVAVTVQFEATRPAALFTALSRLVSSSAISSMMMLAIGVPLRGGLSMGYGFELNSGEVITYGMVTASEIEKGTAVYPRICLDPELVEMCIESVPADLDDPLKRYCAVTWSETQKMLAWDPVTKVYYIDFLGIEAFRPFVDGQGPIQADHAVRLIDSSIADNLSKLHDAGQQAEKARLKWEWLSDYWKGRRDLMTEKHS